MGHFINQDDINWAIRQDRWSCAAVRCLQREMPDALFVRVDTEVVAYSIGGHRYEHSTPQELIDNVIKPLDQGKVVKPFEFELGAPRVTQIKRITPEAKAKLRNIERNRTSVEKAEKAASNNTRQHNRFCE